uniref:tRNA(Ile)-lysidine synthase, chloroplastic n=1 Tax=Hommersandiophycus borowitzkae TaxID=268573 RepID=A0A1G4NTX3_9FLOR|nr:tRNA Ile-lysidine synthetase [Hommersandiophycus borowitzkae]SCW22110.1 tRNA Ile-lysidine synthetase [Hommersandiophycus borowitzkae]
MHSFLHCKLIQNLYHELKIDKGKSILLALSSGQDSLCLLKLFIDIQNITDITLGIVNIDHQCRQDSTINTKHIGNIIKNLNMPSYIYQLQPNQYSEAEFRDMRYQIYINTALRYSYDMIATAHTSTDRLETCLNNLLKGHNFDSLHGLVWKRKLYCNIDLIRPLLNFTRMEISWFCNYHALPIWFDYTNLHYQHRRNRIRYELVPYLQQYYQQDLEKHITKFLDNTYYDMEYLRQQTIKTYYNIKHPHYIAINYHILLRQHVNIQIRVLNLFLTYNGTITLTEQFINKVLKQLKNNTYSQQILFNLRLNIYQSWLYIK